MVDNAALFNALSAAAQRKGKPLSDAERIAIVREIEKGHTREVLRERFLNVIRLAGYREGAPESICNEYLDRYMADIPGFIKMLESYERNYGDPD